MGTRFNVHTKLIIKRYFFAFFLFYFLQSRNEQTAIHHPVLVLASYIHFRLIHWFLKKFPLIDQTVDENVNKMWIDAISITHVSRVNHTHSHWHSLTLKLVLFDIIIIVWDARVLCSDWNWAFPVRGIGSRTRTPSIIIT